MGLRTVKIFIEQNVELCNQITWKKMKSNFYNDHPVLIYMSIIRHKKGLRFKPVTKLNDNSIAV